MKLTPVESSNIAAIGYLEDEQVLLVRYRDGALYAYCGWTAEQYAALLAAESKGKFLAAFDGRGNFTFISKNLEVPYVTGQSVGGTATPPTQVSVAEMQAARPATTVDCSFGVIPK